MFFSGSEVDIKPYNSLRYVIYLLLHLSSDESVMYIIDAAMLFLLIEDISKFHFNSSADIWWHIGRQWWAARRILLAILLTNAIVTPWQVLTVVSISFCLRGKDITS